MKTTNTYTWKTPRGARIEATITVNHITSRTVSADGWPVEVKCNDWLYAVDFDLFFSLCSSSCFSFCMQSARSSRL